MSEYMLTKVFFFFFFNGVAVLGLSQNRRFWKFSSLEANIKRRLFQ